MSATTAISSAEKPPRRFPAPCWTQDETLALIQAYRERWYALRRGCLRTADWDAVAEHVGRLYPGAIPPKTSAQCRHKMEKLRQRYCAERQRALSFPGGRFLSTWFYFESMDSMENNGTGSNLDEETPSGNDLISNGTKIVNSKIKHQSVTNIDSDYDRLNPKPANRFKPVPADSNLLTTAHNFKASHHYNAQEEDNIVFEDSCYVETLIDNKLRQTHKSGARPRKFSQTGSNSYSFWNENGEDHDYNDIGEDDVLPKNRKKDKGTKDNDSISEIVSSIKVLADGFVKMETMKMNVVHEIEKLRMEAEMKREELLLESQRQIVDAFIKGLSEN